MPRAGRAEQTRQPPPPPPDPHLEDHKARARTLYERQNTSTADIAKLLGRPQLTIVGWVGTGRWERAHTQVAQTVRTALLVREAHERATRVAIVERVNIEMQAQALLEHRGEIKKMRSVQTALWTELQNQDKDPDTLMDRVTIFKRLSDASKTVILLERQALGIQGALEDPTQTTDTGLTQAEAAMSSLLGKFASVLGKAKDTPLATEVIDMRE